MTESRRKTKILLLQRDMTFAQLAQRAGLALATVHNVLDGKASSQKSKLSITNALGAEVFDGILPTEGHHTFRKGTTVEFVGNPELAAQWREECGSKVRVRGCTVSFLEDVPVTLLFTEPGSEDFSAAKRTPTRKPKHASSPRASTPQKSAEKESR